MHTVLLNFPFGDRSSCPTSWQISIDQNPTDRVSIQFLSVEQTARTIWRRRDGSEMIRPIL